MRKATHRPVLKHSATCFGGLLPSQSKTLKFDMSGMMRVSSLGSGSDLAGGGASRPGSALMGGGGGGGHDGGAQMRLGSLVKELQEQLQAQARQLQERQGAVERLQGDLCEERELRAKQEQAVKVRLAHAAGLGWAG